MTTLATHCGRGHPWTPDTEYRAKSTGRRSCRACRAITDKAYKLRHPERVNRQKRESAKRKQASEPEVLRAIQRKSYWRNVEKQRQRSRDQRAAEPDKRRAMSRECWAKNGDKYNAQVRARYHANIEQSRARARDRARRRKLAAAAAE